MTCLPRHIVVLKLHPVLLRHVSNHKSFFQVPSVHLHYLLEMQKPVVTIAESNQHKSQPAVSPNQNQTSTKDTSPALSPSTTSAPSPKSTNNSTSNGSSMMANLQPRLISLVDGDNIQRVLATNNNTAITLETVRALFPGASSLAFVVEQEGEMLRVNLPLQGRSFLLRDGQDVYEVHYPAQDNIHRGPGARRDDLINNILHQQNLNNIELHDPIDEDEVDPIPEVVITVTLNVRMKYKNRRGLPYFLIPHGLQRSVTTRLNRSVEYSYDEIRQICIDTVSHPPITPLIETAVEVVLGTHKEQKIRTFTNPQGEPCDFWAFARAPPEDVVILRANGKYTLYLLLTGPDEPAEEQQEE
ncbi:hypothetical protein QAD02_021082 [Eretmocerus hayati]|uniref:Uncharacterized protein n=1 Tax=Eretmocerus hayati TaxID=131215 RepID=A0ACC2PPP5_9HYME|nr:hypothetical protein QAD02_021082 [Eretmocerus hayati]